MSPRGLKVLILACNAGVLVVAVFIKYSPALLGAEVAWPFAVALFLVGLAAFASLVTRFLFTKVGRLSYPPGWTLRHFAEVCFSKKTFTLVLEPALSDMQKEHFDALAEGRLWKARMALLRGYWAFWSAVVAQLPISLARRIYEIWKTTKTGS